MAYHPGKGTQLQLQINSTYTALGQLVDVTPPQIANPSVDVTHLGSSERERIGTIYDGGQVSGTLLHDQELQTHEEMIAHSSMTIRKTTPVNWKIVFPTTTHTIQFAGLLTQYNFQTVQVDDAWRSNIQIDISGPVTLSTI